MTAHSVLHKQCMQLTTLTPIYLCTPKIFHVYTTHLCMPVPLHLSLFEFSISFNWDFFTTEIEKLGYQASDLLSV